jgi:hypothetical protein
MQLCPDLPAGYHACLRAGPDLSVGSRTNNENAWRPHKFKQYYFVENFGLYFCCVLWARALCSADYQKMEEEEEETNVAPLSLLLELPAEVQAHIYSFLGSLPILFSLASVCKGFYLRTSPSVFVFFFLFFLFSFLRLACSLVRLVWCGVRQSSQVNLDACLVWQR